MVSRDAGPGTLPAPATTSESEDAEPAACLAVEMRYALDASHRQVRKRNKALQVRFKDICEAQSEQRDPPPAPGGSSSSAGTAESREARAASYRAAYRKYMTVPARRAIPNVTRSTGVQTSPDLRKCYQTFPLDRKKGSLRGLPGAAAGAADALKSHNNGFVLDATERGTEATPWAAGAAGRVQTTAAALVFRSHQHIDALAQQPPGPSCSEPCGDPGGHSCPGTALRHAPRTGTAAAQDRAAPGMEEPAPAGAQGRVFKTEVATVYTPSNSAATSQWSLCPAEDEGRGRAATQLNGVQAPPTMTTQCQSPERSDRPPGSPEPAAVAGAAGGEEGQQPPAPPTEVVGLKAQLQVMETLISSSQETIKVLLGVIQELEKGEAHREGLSYRTGQDTANCDTCRNSACIIYSVELDFKQQEDKLQPVLRNLHPFEDSQVAPSPYSQEPHASTPKRKPKTEPKKHGRWKLWFL